MGDLMEERLTKRSLCRQKNIPLHLSQLRFQKRRTVMDDPVGPEVAKAFLLKLRFAIYEVCRGNI
jgi:hypothetical protein